MLRYTVRRLLQMVLILWVISVITFFLFWATPANPALLICGKDCTTERIAEVNADYGFDDPLVVQYGRYMSGLVNPEGRMLGSEGSRGQVRLALLRPLTAEQPAGLGLDDRLARADRVAGHRGRRHLVGLRRPAGADGGLAQGQVAGQAERWAGLVRDLVPDPGLRVSAHLRLHREGWSAAVPGSGELEPADRRAGQLVPVLHPAVVHARARVCGVVHPPDPRQHDRHDERGLHPDRPGQGPDGTQGGLQARAASGTDADRDDLRPGPRRPAWRRGDHRNESSASRDWASSRSTRYWATTCRSSWAWFWSPPFFIVVANIVVDVLYAFIDPRVRLS